MMRSEIDESGIPSGLTIIGSDDSRDEYSMLYFVERGVQGSTGQCGMTMSGSGGEMLLISHNTSQVRSLMMGTIVGKGGVIKR